MTPREAAPLQLLLVTCDIQRSPVTFSLVSFPFWVLRLVHKGWCWAVLHWSSQRLWIDFRTKLSVKSRPTHIKVLAISYNQKVKSCKIWWLYSLAILQIFLLFSIHVGLSVPLHASVSAWSLTKLENFSGRRTKPQSSIWFCIRTVRNWELLFFMYKPLCWPQTFFSAEQQGLAVSPHSLVLQTSLWT